MSYRSGARASSSSIVRRPAMPLPITTSRSRRGCWRRIAASHAGLGEAAWQALGQEAAAHVVPPGYGDARHVVEQEDLQREMRTSGRGNRGAETARDQIAAAGADCSDEAQRGGALDA